MLVFVPPPLEAHPKCNRAVAVPLAPCGMRAIDASIRAPLSHRAGRLWVRSTGCGSLPSDAHRRLDRDFPTTARTNPWWRTSRTWESNSETTSLRVRRTGCGSCRALTSCDPCQRRPASPQQPRWWCVPGALPLGSLSFPPPAARKARADARSRSAGPRRNTAPQPGESERGVTSSG